MLTGRKKLILSVCMFLGISSLLGCLSLKKAAEVAGDNREQLPIRSFTITIDPSQREDLFNQLHKFADKHSFEFAFTDYGTNGARFLVEMLRNDIAILAVDIPKAPTMVSISFYDQSFATPVAEETLDKIDDLASDLKSFISEIPNVTILEEK
jgi:hypothetical protein